MTVSEGMGGSVHDSDSKARSRNKALNVAYSWSVGWGLDVQLPPGKHVEGQPDMVVAGQGAVICPRDGARCDRGTCDGECVKQGLVVLDPRKLNSRNVDETLHEMWRLTLVAGSGTPAGFRKPTGSLRARSDDYQATSMRLTPFGRIANPPEWLLKRYEPTVKREADCASRRYSEILRLMRLDVGDLWTVGMLYLCVYLHRHQDLTNEKKNGANLTLFLRQEYRRWASVTCEHLKNITFGSAGIPVCEVVGSPVPGAEYRDAHGKTEVSYVLPVDFEAEAEEEEPEFDSPEERVRYERRAAMQVGRFRKARQRAKTAELEDRLGTMPHDQFVEVLSGVMREERHPVEAREEAERRMKQHMETCEPCRAAFQAWTEIEHQQRKVRVPARRHVAVDRIPTIDDLEDAAPLVDAGPDAGAEAAAAD